jgi:hypothetical protein
MAHEGDEVTKIIKREMI